MECKTPVSLLQEIMQKHNRPLPQYTITQKQGTLEFESSVLVGEVKVSATASSKQEAKHNSARKALQMLGITSQPSLSRVSPVRTVRSVTTNSVGRLNEWASQNHIPYPTYVETTDSICLSFTVRCIFGKLASCGRGNSKKEAKQKAAAEMLLLLEGVNVANILPEQKNNAFEKGSTNDISARVDELAEELFKKLSKNLNEKEKDAMRRPEKFEESLHVDLEVSMNVGVDYILIFFLRN